MGLVTLLLNPATIDIGVSGRADFGITPGFLADVRSRGIVVPIRVQRDRGRFICDQGQRRLMAAKILGLSFIPVKTEPFDF